MDRCTGSYIASENAFRPRTEVRQVVRHETSRVLPTAGCGRCSPCSVKKRNGRIASSGRIGDHDFRYGSCTAHEAVLRPGAHSMTPKTRAGDVDWREAAHGLPPRPRFRHARRGVSSARVVCRSKRWKRAVLERPGNGTFWFVSTLPALSATRSVGLQALAFREPGARRLATGAPDPREFSRFLSPRRCGGSSRGFFNGPLWCRRLYIRTPSQSFLEGAGRRTKVRFKVPSRIFAFFCFPGAARRECADTKTPLRRGHHRGRRIV